MGGAAAAAESKSAVVDNVGRGEMNAGTACTPTPTLPVRWVGGWVGGWRGVERVRVEVSNEND